MSRRRWAVVASAVLVVLIVLGLRARQQEADRVVRAAYQAQGLVSMCDSYSYHPESGGKYPATLADLAAPPFGGASFLYNGSADLIDPWGNPFQYAVVLDERGKLVLQVWTERTVRGETKRIGAKKPAGGRGEMFGL